MSIVSFQSALRIRPLKEDEIKSGDTPAVFKDEDNNNIVHVEMEEEKSR